MRRSFVLANFDWVVLVAGALLITLGCAATTAVPRSDQNRQDPDLELRSILLLLVDRKVLEPFSINRAMAGDAAMRERVALALASIGDRRSRSVLQVLLGDSSPAVRRAAAFGLGELDDSEAMNALLGAVVDPDTLVGRAAIGSLGALGSPLAPVVERLIELEGDELILRLIPELHRFPSSSRSRWAEIGVEAPQLRLDSLLILLAEERAVSREILLPLLDDEQPEVRAAVARGLGRVGDRTDIEHLKRLLAETAAGPVVGALKAAEELIDRAQIAPPADWVTLLRAMLGEPRASVRATALGVAGAWLLDEELALDLLKVAEDDSESRYLRALALSSLLRGGDERGSLVIEAWSVSSNPELRSASARLGDPDSEPELFEELSADSSPTVRLAAIGRRLAYTAVDSLWIHAALRDSDPRIKSAVLRWAVDHPLIQPQELIEAVSGDDRDEAAIWAIRALAARARQVPLEGGEIIAAVEYFARHPNYLVRREAGHVLQAFGRPAPSAGSSDAMAKSTSTYREIVLQTATPRRLLIRTERGPIEVELWCPRVPLTCLNFLQLARQGFYDGRLIDGGEPTAFVTAGAGGAGFTIRDEKLPETVDRGTLAMVRKEPDTAGGEFLIASTRLPHLDRNSLPFGRVVAGQSIVDDLIPGERILAIDAID